MKKIYLILNHFSFNFQKFKFLNVEIVKEAKVPPSFLIEKRVKLNIDSVLLTIPLNTKRVNKSSN